MLPETSMSTWIPALHGWNDAVEDLLEFDRRHATPFSKKIIAGISRYAHRGLEDSLK